MSDEETQEAKLMDAVEEIEEALERLTRATQAMGEAAPHMRAILQQQLADAQRAAGFLVLARKLVATTGGAQ